MAITLKHQTKAEFAARFWAKLMLVYKGNDKLSYSRMIWWLYQRIQDGSFTSDQIRQSFNTAYGRSLNTSQWNSFVTTRLIPIKDRYQEILDEGDL